MNKAILALENLLLLNFAAFVLFFYKSKLFVKIILIISILVITLIVILELLLSRIKKMPSPVVSLKYFSKNLLLKPVFIFFLCSILSTLLSIDPIHSQRVLFERFIYYFLFFMFGCYLAKSNKSLFILSSLFIISGLIIGVLGLKEYFHFSNAGRLYLLFGKPFNFTPFLLFFLPLNFAIAFFAKNKLMRLLGTVTLITWALCYYWNYSRAVWIAVPLALLIITLLKNRRLSVILLLIFMLIFPLLNSSFKNRAGTVLDTLTWGGRVDLYKSALKIYCDFPFFGAGLGMYEKLLHTYPALKIYSINNIHLHAHSTYLEVAANMGTLGILSFLGIFVIFFIVLLKNKPSWEKRPADQQAILLGLSTSILASLIVAFSTTIIIVGVQDPAIFWFFFGIASSLL